ncbi:MAG: 2-C-methyl-D-erythritol 2,4-cyclodiphosphate synthase [Bacilli bacterium]|jgi:2-C-methyl-D-erythritol 2,4-cyclodiphosphate synthase
MFSMIRIGYGKDIHALVIGKPLVLGTVTIPSMMGLSSYSDGDVVVHSLVDAILGALAKGDIGTMFPDNEPRNKGRHSIEFLKEIRPLISSCGYKINNIDISITCEKPKLANYIVMMRGSIAMILGINITQVSIKAGTNEGFDSIGKEEAIEATSVVLLEGVK